MAFCYQQDLAQDFPAAPPSPSAPAAAWSCPTLCDSLHCRPPGSPVHGVFQARMLEWVAIPLARGSSQARNRTRVSCTAGGFFTVEPLAGPSTIWLPHKWFCNLFVPFETFAHLTSKHVCFIGTQGSLERGGTERGWAEGESEPLPPLLPFPRSCQLPQLPGRTSRPHCPEAAGRGCRVHTSGHHPCDDTLRLHKSLDI